MRRKTKILLADQHEEVRQVREAVLDLQRANQRLLISLGEAFNAEETRLIRAAQALDPPRGRYDFGPPIKVPEAERLRRRAASLRDKRRPLRRGVA